MSKNAEIDSAEASEESREKPLLSLEILLSAQVHLGSRTKVKAMEPFIYKVRPDGIVVLDVKKLEERIRIAAKFIAQFEPSKVLVVSSKDYGKVPVEKFCSVTGCTAITGRFLPGLLSNPLYSGQLEPALILISDPDADSQALNEAFLMGLPAIAICNADNIPSKVDLIIPANNRNRLALATVYWLLARQVLRERGQLKPDEELPISIDDFVGEEEGSSER